MARFPRLSDLDFSSFDLTRLDLSQVDLSQVDTDKLVGVVRDAAYVVIGFGVLTVQQVQVRRRELVKNLATNPVVQQMGATPAQIDDLVTAFETRVGQVDERLQELETKLDAAVGAFEQRLPEQAGVLLGQAHDVAKAARTQMRGFIRNAA